MSRRTWFFIQKMVKKKGRNKTQFIVISKLHSLDDRTEIIGKGLTA